MEDAKARIVEYVRRRFCEFESDGFSIFSRLPSGNTARYVRGFMALSDARKDLVRDAIAMRAAQWWGYPYDFRSSEPCVKAFDEFTRMTPYPWDVVRHGEKRAPVAQIRKAAKLMFGQLFGCAPVKSIEPGDWFYSGVVMAAPVVVQIRYSTRMAPLLYGMRINEVGDYYSFSLENLFGMGLGDWDNIMLGGEDQACALLRDTILAGVAECLEISRIAERIKNA
ncbi:MAG: hypothetical protein QM715_08745 [Nibricoccus sp.]